MIAILRTPRFPHRGARCSCIIGKSCPRLSARTRAEGLTTARMARPWSGMIGIPPRSIGPGQIYETVKTWTRARLPLRNHGVELPRNFSRVIIQIRLNIFARNPASPAPGFFRGRKNSCDAWNGGHLISEHSFVPDSIPLSQAPHMEGRGLYAILRIKRCYLT